VDKEGNTLDFMLRAKRDAVAACRFFRKTLKAKHTQTPRVINVDKNPALTCAIGNLKVDGFMPSKTVLRQVKFLNNIVEQDHRFIKIITMPALGFKSCRTASKTLCVIETMHMTQKGQIKRVAIGCQATIKMAADVN
jgi:transposase-like protein